MRSLKWIALVAVLLAPTSSWAFGLSVAAGAGYMTTPGESRVAVEASPFYDVSILRFEVPIEYELRPTSPSLAVGVGAKVFIPITGLYVRGSYEIGGLLTDAPDKTHTFIVGPGWELSLLDTIGAFAEITGEPQIAPERAFTLMARIGVFLNL